MLLEQRFYYYFKKERVKEDTASEAYFRYLGVNGRECVRLLIISFYFSLALINKLHNLCFKTQT